MPPAASPVPGAPVPPSRPAALRVLALLAAAELLGMSPWFAANAVAPQLERLWHLDAAGAGLLTTVVQLGFVAGTAVAAVLNLADVIPARFYFAGSAALAAVANGLLLIVPDYHTALATRFLTGFFLAGVYPPGMKMAATWFREYRGLAIGAVVGALTVGKALPYLVHALRGAELRLVVSATSAQALAAALLIALLYRDGPFAFPRRAFSWRLVATVVRHRGTRLATAGYLGHMWELYAMWIWVPAFLAAAAAARRAAGLPAPGAHTVDLLSFGAIAIGGAGCVWGGWWARRAGYAKVVTRAMAVSGACALAVGAAFGASFWLLMPLVACWGFFVVADSAQFSALVTEVAPTDGVGTALTLQTSMGFLLTMVTIQAIPHLVDAFGWPWAFPLLALGPAAGIASIRRLQRPRGSRQIQG
jgi:MFS family permease